MVVDPRQEIALVNEHFMSLVRTGDKTAFARLYTEDAVLMLPNTEALSGRAGALKFLMA